MKKMKKYILMRKILNLSFGKQFGIFFVKFVIYDAILKISDINMTSF